MECYINYSDRLFVVDKGTHFLVKGEIKNHKHSTRPDQVETLCKKTLAEEKLIKTDAEAPDLEEKPIERPVYYYKKERLASKSNLLSDEQFAILQAPLPLKVSGGPGTGKTLVAIELLMARAKQAHAQNKLRLLFTCKSPYLLQKVEEEFKAHDKYHEIKPLIDLGFLEIHFKTSDEALFQKGDLKESKEADEQSFGAWLQDYLRDQRNHNIVPSPAFLFENPELLQQEFRTINGKNLSDYEALGEKSSYVKDPKERPIVFSAFKAWKAKHPSDDSTVKNDTYDFIAYDESQDEDHKAMKQACVMAHGQIAYFNSGAQRLYDGLSNEANFSQLIPSYYALKEVVLSQSFRNPEVVSKAINHLSGIQRDFFKRLERSFKQEPEIVPQEGKPGRIKWRQAAKEPKQTLNLRRAVITSAANKARAIEIYGPNVFTIEEIKGLEFDEIILFNFFDDEQFANISRILQGKQRPRRIDLEAPEAFQIAFNKAKTALSRTTNKLTIVQEPNHKISAFLEEFKKGLPSTAFDESSDEEEEDAPATEEEVLAQAKDFYLGDHKEQALGLLKAFGKTEEACAQIIKTWQEKPKENTKTSKETEQEAEESASAEPTNPSTVVDTSAQTDSTSEQSAIAENKVEENTLTYQENRKRYMDALQNNNATSTAALFELLGEQHFKRFLEQEKTELAKNPKHQPLLLEIINEKDGKRANNLTKFLKKLASAQNAKSYTQALVDYVQWLCDADPKFLLMLASHKYGFGVFSAIIENSAFVKKLSILTLFGKPNLKLTEHSLATYLASDPQKCLFLRWILDENPSLREHIFLGLIHKKGEGSIDDYFGSMYLLQTLVLNEEGRRLIQDLIEKTSMQFPQVLKDSYANLLSFPTAPKFLKISAVQAALVKYKWLFMGPQVFVHTGLKEEGPSEMKAAPKNKKKNKKDKASAQGFFNAGKPQELTKAQVLMDVAQQFDITAQVIGCPNQENLSRLFQAQDLHFLLFETPVKHHKSLFDFLIRETSFRDFLLKNENRAAARTLANCLFKRLANQASPFYQLTKIPLGGSLIYYLISLDHEMNIPPKAFFETDEEGNTAFCNLIQSKEAEVEVLIKNMLRRENDTMLRSLDSSWFVFPPEKIYDEKCQFLQERYDTLLSFLLKYQKTALIYFLLEKRPSLIELSFIEDIEELDRIIEACPSMINHSGIARLLQSELGCEILYKIAQNISKMPNGTMVLNGCYVSLREASLWSYVKASPKYIAIKLLIKPIIKTQDAKEGPQQTLPPVTGHCNFFEGLVSQGFTSLRGLQDKISTAIGLQAPEEKTSPPALLACEENQALTEHPEGANTNQGFAQK